MNEAVVHEVTHKLTTVIIPGAHVPGHIIKEYRVNNLNIALMFIDSVDFKGYD